MVEGPKEEKKEESPEEETRRNLAFLLEKVEGCSVSLYNLLWLINHSGGVLFKFVQLVIDDQS